MTSGKNRVAVGLSADVRTAIGDAARAAHPRETGGLLLGWWNAGAVVVSRAIEVPDPGATTTSWTRDRRAAQLALDAALDQDPHPWLGYVGDWHTHPAVTGRSRPDIAELRRISRQYSQPVVLIVHRVDGTYDVAAAAEGRTRTVVVSTTEGELAPP